VGCHPGLIQPSSLAGSAKEFRQGGITHRLAPTLATSADEKDKGAYRIVRTFGHDIGIHGLQCVRLVKINHALDSTLGPEPFGMVTPTTNDHSTPAIGDIFQVQGEYFAWA
jgi:hypothetical protein